jgi:hypothetical protein
VKFTAGFNGLDPVRDFDDGDTERSQIAGTKRRNPHAPAPAFA